jgi:hypothetical protein
MQGRQGLRRYPSSQYQAYSGYHRGRPKSWNSAAKRRNEANYFSTHFHNVFLSIVHCQFIILVVSFHHSS